MQAGRMTHAARVIPADGHLVSKLTGSHTHAAAGVEFRTPGGSAAPDTRVLVVSCDRFLDVPDDEEFVLQMGDAAGPESERPYDVMVHAGDQIYADSLFRRLRSATFGDALAAFREAYRKSWSRPAMAKLL